MPEVQMILQSGWAIASSMWTPWKVGMADSAANVRIKVNERGYFEKKATQALFEDRDSFNILVAHSLGLHFISEAQIEACNLLVVIGGFLHFHNGTERHSRMSHIVIKKMLNKLDSDQASVIADFYRNCGFAQSFIDATAHLPANKDVLKRDLKLLDESVIYPQLLFKKGQPKVLILHGAEDEIVPVHHAREFQTHVKKGIIAVHPTAGHALPHSDADWCLGKIQEIAGTNFAGPITGAKK